MPKTSICHVVYIDVLAFINPSTMSKIPDSVVHNPSCVLGQFVGKFLIQYYQYVLSDL